MTTAATVATTVMPYAIHHHPQQHTVRTEQQSLLPLLPQPSQQIFDATSRKHDGDTDDCTKQCGIRQKRQRQQEDGGGIYDWTPHGTDSRAYVWNETHGCWAVGTPRTIKKQRIEPNMVNISHAIALGLLHGGQEFFLRDSVPPPGECRVPPGVTRYMITDEGMIYDDKTWGCLPMDRRRGDRSQGPLLYLYITNWYTDRMYKLNGREMYSSKSKLSLCNDRVCFIVNNNNGSGTAGATAEPETFVTWSKIKERVLAAQSLSLGPLGSPPASQTSPMKHTRRDRIATDSDRIKLVCCDRLLSEDYFEPSPSSQGDGCTSDDS